LQPNPLLTSSHESLLPCCPCVTCLPLLPAPPHPQAALELASLHESLVPLQNNDRSAPDLLRVGGLVLLATEVAAAVATGLVVDARMQQEQQLSVLQQPRHAVAPTQAAGGLLDLAAASLMESHGLGWPGPGAEQRGACAAAQTSSGGSDATGLAVRRLLGLLLGSAGSCAWGLDTQEGQGTGSVAELAAEAGATVNGAGVAAHVTPGVVVLVAAGLPHLLAVMARALTSWVLGAVTAAAELHSGAAAAVAAASASVSCASVHRMRTHTLLPCVSQAPSACSTGTWSRLLVYTRLPRCKYKVCGPVWVHLCITARGHLFKSNRHG